MDFQKESEAYLKMLVGNDAISNDQAETLKLMSEGSHFYTYGNQVSATKLDLINWGWNSWVKAKSQAVPEGFALVPVKEIKTWYLDDSEGIYREDPDWLCDISVGEVVEVEHRVSYELDQDPVFAAIEWDEVNGDVGYYETFKTKAEAEAVAAHCKAMVEAQEQNHD